MSLQAQDMANKPLFGKKATHGEIAKYVAQCIKGTARKPPMTITGIARELGYKDPKSIRALRALAIEMKYLVLDENGKVKQNTTNQAANFMEFVAHDDFAQHPLIKSWIDSMTSRKQGQPLKSARDRITMMKNLCNHLKADPDYFISAGETKEVLEHVRKIMRGFNSDLLAGKFKTRKGSDPAYALYRYVQTVRDFVAFHGYSFPRGEQGIMAQSIAKFHGNYADVKLTPEQIEIILNNIVINEGINSDIYRVVSFGLQSCARRKAIIGCKLDNIEEILEKDKLVYIIEVFESKAEHRNKGIWKKYITWPALQGSIDLRRGRHLIEDRSEAGIKKLIKRLKDLYTIAQPRRLDYFLSHPFHALRHAGAHIWLDKCNYNHSLVAILGGWHTADELKASYGAIPHKKILESIL